MNIEEDSDALSRLSTSTRVHAFRENEDPLVRNSICDRIEIKKVKATFFEAKRNHLFNKALLVFTICGFIVAVISVYVQLSR